MLTFELEALDCGKRNSQHTLSKRTVTSFTPHAHVQMTVMVLSQSVPAFSSTLLLTGKKIAETRMWSVLNLYIPEIALQ